MRRIQIAGAISAASASLLVFCVVNDVPPQLGSDAASPDANKPLDASSESTLTDAFDAAPDTLQPWDASPVEVASNGVASPFGIGVDQNYLYWTTGYTYEVQRCPVGTTCPIPLHYASGTGQAWDMAVFGTHLFWVERDSAMATADSGPTGAVWKCDTTLPCSSPTLFASQLLEPRHIAVDGVNVFVGAADGVYRCPIAGCGNNKPTPMITGFAMGRGAGIASDGTTLYAFDGAHIVSCSATGLGCGNAPTQNATDTSGVDWLGIGGNRLFWTDHLALVGCTGPCGNNAGTVAATVAGDGNGIAVDGAWVYWVEGGVSMATGRVMRCPSKAACPQPQVLATNQAWPTSIVVDSNNVYWTNAGVDQQHPGSVMMLSKPP